MRKKSSPLMFRFQILIVLLLTAMFTVGCSHKKTNRGHLYRCEWAFEHNRTPWIGCPPDSGCDDERGCGASDCCAGGGGGSGMLDCFKRDNGKSCCCNNKKNSGFRRHCGMNPECTSKRPCCRTLGCGMWVDPSDPNTFAALGGGVKACGLTAFCSPMKPCGLTPNCGRVVNQPFMNQQAMMLGNMGMPMQGGMGGMQGMPTATPMMPTPVTPGTTPKGGTDKGGNNKKPTTVAGPTGLLISRGIVPGASSIVGGGVVASPGVATRIGMMTPTGVQMPNGMLNANAVIRACAMPGCSAARPCGMTPGCGMMVSVTQVAVNPMMLASATHPNGGVMQAGAVPGVMAGAVPGYTGNVMMTAGGIPLTRNGTGMLVNPVTGQVVGGLTMNGYPQNGYPPIGYAPTGYSPGYPRYAGTAAEVEEEAEEETEETAEAEQQSPMPVPRFHPIPSKPVFQRSEGMPRTAPGEKRAAAGGRIFSDDNLSAAIEQAYLEGMSDAMDEVEEELEVQAQERAKMQLQEKILNQAKKLQSQLETQKELELQVLEMEKRQVLAQIETQEQARKLAERKVRERAAKEQYAEQLAMAESLQNRRPQPAPMMQNQALSQIPSNFQAATQPVYPVNYNSAYHADPQAGESGKNVFASAVQFLKGDDRSRGPNSPAMSVPYMPQPALSSNVAQQQLAIRQQRQMAFAHQGGTYPMQAHPAQSASGMPSGIRATGAGLLSSAKSAGGSVVSAVGDAVSPLSGLFGSDRPQTLPPRAVPMRQPVYQQPVTQRSVSGKAVPTPDYLAATNRMPLAYPYPCPPSPPFVTSKAEENLSQQASFPKKPPTARKKPKRVIDVDDFDHAILQANYEEEE